MFTEGAFDWGDGSTSSVNCGRRVRCTVPGALQVFGSGERICASPGMAMAALLAYKAGRRPCSSADGSRSPTLILHREDSFVPVELRRYLAREIRDAKYVEFPKVRII